MVLSHEQSVAFAKFRQGHNLVVTGPGGTGKSKLIEHFVSYCIDIRKNIQVTALTGCASLLLGLNAKTIHSWSGIRLCKGPNDDIIEKAVRNRRTSKNWKSAQILIIDEASMMSAKMLEVLNAIGQKIRKSDRPFGGIQVVLTCDFYQLPPIGSHDDETSGQFCFESPVYNTIFPWENHVVLTKIFRQTDQQYINILNEIREGQIGESNAELLRTYVNRTYDKSKYGGAALTKLFPTKSRVDAVNDAMFKQIDADTHMYCAEMCTNGIVNHATKKNIDAETIHICNKLTAQEKENELQFLMNNTPCIKELELKKGATIMCTANIDLSIGICNGSQGIIVDFVGDVPKVQFYNGVIKLMEKHVWASETYPTIYIMQYPIMLAWAITIHKIQGTTLAMAEMDIGQNIFTYGQTYVALSRIKSLDGLYLSSFEPSRVKANPKVKHYYSQIPATPTPEPELVEEPPEKDPNIKVIKHLKI